MLKNCLIDIDHSMFTRGLEGGEGDRFKQLLLLTKDDRTKYAQFCFPQITCLGYVGR